VSFTGSDIVFNTENLLTGSYYAVTNSVGQLIASGSITDDTWTVSATKLSSGIYLYQILNDSQKATGKVFVH